LPVHPPLASSITAEVCVIGAGIGGLTTAYLLARQGVSVAVVEAIGIGAGETGRTTAHIAVPDDRYWYIEQTHDADTARLVADSFAAAADCIETNVRTEQIDCDFARVDGYLFSCAASPRAELQRELEAARRACVDVAMEEQLPFAGLGAGPCLRFRRQAQFHPLRYLGGLASAIERRRGAIFTGRVIDVEERDDGVTVRTATGRIIAGSAVVAANTPFNDRVAIHTKQYAYQTYVVAATVEEGALPRVLLWDDGDPYHYIRLAPGSEPGQELLIVGGADHKTGQASDPQRRFAELEAWMRERFPQAGELAYRWSGEVMEPLDGLAYLGRNPGSEHVYVITGDSGNGITHATIGGMLVSDLIMGRQNRWLGVYEPGRKPLKETMQFLREQTHIAAQYADWVSAGDDIEAAALAPGEGALISSGLKKFAVYRDDEGALHCHSARCPHLGCVVRWNGAEKTWDCPCHGSRFDAYGSVLHGPAVSALAAVDEEERAAVTGAPRQLHRLGDHQVEDRDQ
jgi:glycine/D-amino acid oxidase-like deaminating enzyme/nitrite reductase/ring-hydroxylating ferredoxin subunit